MTLRASLLGAAMLTSGAAPPSSFNTSPVVPPIVAVRPQPLATNTPLGFEPAPLPDRDAFAPHARASHDASVAPTIFTRRDQYRGEGLNAASSAQAEQDRRVQPGAGINLSMPLQ